MVVERAGADARQPTSFYVVADYRAAGLLRLVPRRIRDWAYDVVATHRYDWFGRHDHCVVPRPEVRGRFIDR